MWKWKRAIFSAPRGHFYGRICRLVAALKAGLIIVNCGAGGWDLQKIVGVWEISFSGKKVMLMGHGCGTPVSVKEKVEILCGGGGFRPTGLA